MSYDNENIFAKILRGEIPCHKVFENNDALVFMDVMPQAPGHAHHDDALLILRHFGDRLGRGERAQPAQHRTGTSRHSAQKFPPRNQVLL